LVVGPKSNQNQGGIARFIVLNGVVTQLDDAQGGVIGHQQINSPQQNGILLNGCFGGNNIIEGVELNQPQQCFMATDFSSPAEPPPSKVSKQTTLN
jgi:hypothetical protein